jgi:3-deoxy-manno-octulosonate cytidylyltransferase (CMP-KDO synthetase)
MEIIGIVPGRMGSSRYPGKPLAKILGVPMVAHCYARSKMSKLLTDTVVATCDKEIEDYCLARGIEVVMTSDKHERASDRCAEAAEKMEARKGKKYDIVVLIQGDEPMLTPEMIDMSLEPMLNDSSIKVVNLMAPLETREEMEDPNEVKVVVDQDNNALYFSREPIPSDKKSKDKVTGWKQVCIIPFQRDFLVEYGKLKPTPLEIIESVDMNRVLEHGMKVKMVPENVLTYSVDTPEDLADVEEAMKGDSLIGQYAGHYKM